MYIFVLNSAVSRSIFHMLEETLCDIAANSFALGLVVHVCIRSIWSNNLNHPHIIWRVLLPSRVWTFISALSPAYRTSATDSDDKRRGCGW
ncbi:hypothetical protein TNIN_214011 [Trichonephila inaurata madagascariensis]|uniref:Uncharacterized protein n=1 Tax=Trichonephila inaurata madagascariensis TaxID=2747483 RepID=A0A8X6XJH4_9ARAC|nr:hypothetical protein TNIN_214011 [Trichonephila inaurata madagascariensis]